MALLCQWWGVGIWVDLQHEIESFHDVSDRQLHRCQLGQQLMLVEGDLELLWRPFWRFGIRLIPGQQEVSKLRMRMRMRSEVTREREELERKTSRMAVLFAEPQKLLKSRILNARVDCCISRLAFFEGAFGIGAAIEHERLKRSAVTYH